MKSKDKILIICLVNILGSLVTLLPFIGPLICWICWKDDADAAVADYARRRLNASFSWTIWIYGSYILSFVGIGLLMLFVLGIWWLIAIIKDVIRASSGDTSYKFPLTIQFIKAKPPVPGSEG